MYVLYKDLCLAFFFLSLKQFIFFYSLFFCIFKFRHLAVGSNKISLYAAASSSQLPSLLRKEDHHRNPTYRRDNGAEKCYLCYLSSVLVRSYIRNLQFLSVKESRDGVDSLISNNVLHFPSLIGLLEKISSN